MGEGDSYPDRKKIEEMDDSSLSFKCFCPRKWCIFSGSAEAFQEHLKKDHRIPLRDFQYGKTIFIPDLSPENPFEILRGEDGNIFVVCYATTVESSDYSPIPAKESKSDAMFVVSLQPPGSDLGPQYVFTLKVSEGPPSRLRIRYTTGQSDWFKQRPRLITWPSKPVLRSTLRDLYEHVSEGFTFEPTDIHKRSLDAHLCILQATPVPVPAPAPVLEQKS